MLIQETCLKRRCRRKTAMCLAMVLGRQALHAKAIFNATILF